MGVLLGFQPVEPKEIGHEFGQTCCNAMRKLDEDWPLAGLLAFDTKIPLFLPLCSQENTTYGMHHVLDFQQTAPSIAIVVLFEISFEFKCFYLTFNVNQTFHVEQPNVIENAVGPSAATND